MLRQIIGFLITCILALVVTLGVVAEFKTKYVTGAYSKYCYVKGHENTNIKKLIVYKTLEQCGKPLHK